MDRKRTAAYSLGFFLGPGLPLGFGTTSTPWPRPRLLPGFGPGIPFLFGISATGVGVVPVPAAGVEAASEPLPAEEAGAPGAAVVEEGDEEALSWSPLSGAELPGKRPRAVDDTFRTIVLLGLGEWFDRPDDEVEEAPVVCEDGIVQDAVGS
jgi:hypothetical protein